MSLMKGSRLILSTWLLLCSGLLHAEPADPWTNRPNVIKAAETLFREIKALDEALHLVTSSSHILQKVHHFQETSANFTASVEGGCTYNKAVVQFNHIHSDLHAVSKELNYHHHLLHNPKVATEWRHVRVAYNNLDLEMFHLIKERWSAEKAQSVRDSLEEIESSHLE